MEEGLQNCLQKVYRLRSSKFSSNIKGKGSFQVSGRQPRQRIAEIISKKKFAKRFSIKQINKLSLIK